MSCEICSFVDPRHYSFVRRLIWENDGIPLFTTKAVCAECGWVQAVDQIWVVPNGDEL